MAALSKLAPSARPTGHQEPSGNLQLPTGIRERPEPDLGLNPALGKLPASLNLCLRKPEWPASETAPTMPASGDSRPRTPSPGTLGTVGWDLRG